MGEARETKERSTKMTTRLTSSILLKIDTKGVEFGVAGSLWRWKSELPRQWKTFCTKVDHGNRNITHIDTVVSTEIIKYDGAFLHGDTEILVCRPGTSHPGTSSPCPPFISRLERALLFRLKKMQLFHGDDKQTQ
jgi:hypothetical protein